MSGGWDARRRTDFAVRLWRKDTTLWSADPAHQRVAADRLGWLDLPARMRGEVAGLRRFAAEVAEEEFTHVVLLGMGGSSLAPEVMSLMSSARNHALDLTVLDNTSPAAVRAVADAHDPRRTLFLVASKSGTTVEVSCFERYFFEWVRRVQANRAGRSFVAITDPGTPLEKLARKRGYRRVFLNPTDVGGRYSALSLFGLVPAALIGTDLDALLESAAAELAASQRDPLGGEGVGFGAELGAAALAGRDKLTLAFSPAWAPFGTWVEQLVAESTGKDGRGILPVEGETIGAAALAAADRVFVSTPDLEAALGRAIAHSACPAWLMDLPGPAALGAAFLRWEIATATAAAVLELDPFDEPNVAEAKQATETVLERALAEGHFPEEPPLAEASGCRIWAAGRAERALQESRVTEPASAVGALLALARPGDYLALLAYLRRTPAVHERLQRLRAAAGALCGLATTLGYGPRFQHSTGQLHKGGPDTGLFLQITADEGPDLEIPGERFSFATLRRAQAAGDFEVLARRGRRIVRLHLDAPAERALDAVIEDLARVGTA
jgi:glucose-6-phosphate isomerase